MLVFSGFVPHSPLLLPEIAKAQAEKMHTIHTAMDEFADELYATHPDTIVLISQHPTMFEGAFSINVSDPYTFDLKELGQLAFDKKIHPDFMLIDRLQRSLRSKQMHVTLTSDEALNYASAVPLSRLTQNHDVKLVPITTSGLTPKEHFQFGQALKDTLFESNKRIAVIAAGDMAHTLTKQSPAGFHKDGKAFDTTLQELIANKNTVGLLGFDQNIIKNAQEHAYKPLLILFGLLERISVEPKILSYDAPFGVGLMVTNFVLR
jgi:aromatic ring-opening dioxygenase LigB subunit